MLATYTLDARMPLYNRLKLGVLLSLGEGEIDRRKEDGVKYGTTNQGTWTFYLNFWELRGATMGLAPPPLVRRMEGPWWEHGRGRNCGGTMHGVVPPRGREGLGGRPRLQVRTLPTHWPRVNFPFSAKYFMIFEILTPKNQTMNLPNQRKFFFSKDGLILRRRSLERINVSVWRRRPPRRKEGKKFHKNLFLPWMIYEKMKWIKIWFYPEWFWTNIIELN